MARWPMSRSLARLFGRTSLGPMLGASVLCASLLTLSACQSAPPPEVVAAPPPPPSAPRITLRPPRPKRPDAACLSAGRKQELFRKFAALHEGDGAEAASEAPPPPPPRECKPGGK